MRSYGFSHEAAAILGISDATAKRWWAYARAWLLDEIRFSSGGRAQIQR
ncbi:MAG TPA: ECF-type sigma factor [Verrucomicrobiae bacterium]